MLNQTGVQVSSYGNRKSILVDNVNSTAVSVMVSNSGVNAGSDGKKVVKAGTPVYGDLLDRSKAFTVASTGDGAAATKVAGVILHDVEVTSGTANSQMVIFGTIDVSKLDTATATALKGAVSGLKMIQLVSQP